MTQHILPAPLGFPPRTDQGSALISVVVPFFNEADSIEPLCERLTSVLERLGMRWEIVAVDDGSRDDGFVRMAARAKSESRLKIVRLARNFGKERAMLAGLHHARGDAVVIMDADLQHPPEMIADFVAHWRAGFQIVHGLRVSREDQSALRRLLVTAFYRLFHSTADIRLPNGATDFCLMDRAVVDALAVMPEHGRFLKGLLMWVGFRHISVPFRPEPRPDRQSTWTLRHLIAFACDGLLSFSHLPLRLWLWVGAVITLAATGYGGWLVALTVAGSVPNETHVLGAVLTLVGGIELLALGTIGEYLGRVLTEVRRRPLYLVAERIGIDRPTATAALAAVGGP